MKIRTMTFLASAVALAIIAGCDREVDDSAQIAQEERYFNLYMTAKYPDLEADANGLYYIDFKEGDGLVPDSGDYVLMNYVAYTIPDETVVDTYTEDLAQENNIYVSGALYGPFKYLVGSGIEGFDQGLYKMKEGGIARVLFKSDLGYGDQGFGTRINAYESLMYDLELIEVIKNAWDWEFEKMQDYLEGFENVITIYDEESDIDMYYIPTKSGEGDPLEEGDEIEVFYTGQLLDGRVFDSNDGNTSGLNVTLGEGSVIDGWEIGLLKFNWGGSGKLLIPHQLAYGEEGSSASNSTMYSIPPYEPLLFDISVEPEAEEESEEE